MNYITLDPQQTASVTAATNPLEVRGPDGTVVGFIYPRRGAEAVAPPDLDPFTEADIAEAKRRSLSDSPRYTTQQVLDHLRSLEGR